MICIVCKIKRSSFTFFGQTKSTHCGSCKEVGMININNKKCFCGLSQPYFNFSDKINATHCSICKEIGMINVKDKKCFCGNSKPTFNFSGQKKATHCGSCKEIGMINVKHKKCFCGKSQPSFNFPDQSKATHCGICKEVGMLNIKNKKCFCNKSKPYFNFSDQKIATHCNDCKEIGMINIINKKCMCKKCIPVFNFPDQKIATHCNDCKEVGMINILSKRCKICKKIEPIFNFTDQKIATHCSNCKEIGMINVKHKRCIVCNIRSSYGFISTGQTHCAKHKQQGMFLKPNRKCLECNELAIYGIKEPTHCETHLKDKEISLLAKPCEKCCKIDVLKDGLCITYCIPENIHTIKKREKKFENMVLKYLNENVDTECKVKDDEIPDSSCNKRRPDRVYDCGTHFVVIEIDENQHRSYSSNNTNCECIRMHQIYESLGLKTVFIRFNPNSYKSKKKLSMEKRLELLKKYVLLTIKEFPKSECQVLYKQLFYDYFDESDTTYDELKI